MKDKDSCIKCSHVKLDKSWRGELHMYYCAYNFCWIEDFDEDVCEFFEDKRMRIFMDM